MSESNREVELEVRERRLKVLETCLGPSIMHYMHDDNVTEVMVNPDGRVWLDTFDKGFQKTEVIMKVGKYETHYLQHCRYVRAGDRSQNGSVLTGEYTGIPPVRKLSISGRVASDC